MSYVVSVTCSGLPAWEAIRERLSLPELRCHEPPPDQSAPLPEGTTRLFLHGRSTRMTLVAREGARFDVTVLALAAPEDAELALRVVEALAQLGSAATVTSEIVGETTLADLRRHHDDDWFDGQIESGARVLRHMVTEGRGPMQVPGPVRSFWLGTRVLAELEAAGPAGGFASRLLERARQVQWFDDGRIPTAGVFEVGSDSGRRPTLAVWLGESVVFPGVDYAALDPADGSKIVIVPAAAVPGLAGDRWRFLDERQGVIEDVRAEWPSVIARARQLQVEIPA